MEVSGLNMFSLLGRLIRLGLLGYLNQVGLVCACAEFQLSSWSRSARKVGGSGVRW